MMWTPNNNQGVATKKKGFALGVIFRNIRFDQILEKILNVPNVPLAWLSEMTAGRSVREAILIQLTTQKGPKGKSVIALLDIFQSVKTGIGGK